MFSGRDGTRSKPVGKEWTKYTLFTKSETDRARCQFHLRCVFPEREGTVRYRNFLVTANGVEVGGFGRAFDSAAALAELHEMGMNQIEYAAEMAMEHHLGLTCDPVAGLVQIPCIERNAVAAMRAINALSLANFLSGTRKISFDMVVETMYETGRDLHLNYRETARGGLAKLYQEK